MSDEQVPRWFTDALAAPVETGAVEVAGARITFRCWGEAGRPGLVLVHGGGAHAHWWDHIAPLLAAGAYRVAALDLSGHGDSDRRADYGLSTWAREVVAVACAAGIDGRPVVIGHSMGGWVTFAVAADHPDTPAGIIVIDSPLFEISPEEQAARRRSAFGPLKTYPTREEAIARFRTVPRQDALPYVLAHIADTSVRPVDGGWTWRFDPNLFSRGDSNADLLTRIQGRVALFRPEFGLVTPDIGARMYELLGRVAPVVDIPAAAHHVMLDQPIALVTGLRAVLADWEHSTPSARGTSAPAGRPA